MIAGPGPAATGKKVEEQVVRLASNMLGLRGPHEVGLKMR